METALDKYIRTHSDTPNPALEWVEKQTNIKTNYPRMLSGAITGELLTLIAKMCGAKHILEIGCLPATLPSASQKELKTKTEQ